MKSIINAACIVLLLSASCAAQAAPHASLSLSDQDLLAPTCTTPYADAAAIPYGASPNSSSQCHIAVPATQEQATSVPEAPMVAMLLIGLGLLGLTRRTTTEKFEA